jgi:hypothetical protein
MPVLEILEQKLSVNKFQYIKSKLSPLEIDFERYSKRYRNESATLCGRYRNVMET